MIRSGNIAQALKNLGHDVFALTTSGGKSALIEAGFKGNVILVPCSLFLKNERGNFDRLSSYFVSSIMGCIAARKIENIDIIYTDSDYPCDIIPAREIRKRNPNARWVAMVHHLLMAENTLRSSVISTKLKIGLQNWGLQFIAKRADAAFVYESMSGRLVAKVLTEKGLPPLAITYVNNGYSAGDLNRVLPSATHYKAVLLGGLRPGKGLREVVPIWQRVVRSMPSARLGLIGGISAQYRAELVDSLKSANIEHSVDILGTKPRDEAIALLKGADLLFAPSLEEGWGIAVCEALACAVPVVAYDLPVYRDLFPEGMISVPMGDHETFAKSIEMLLMDPVKRDVLGQAGKRSVERFEWQDIARHEIEAFASVRAQSA